MWYRLVSVSKPAEALWFWDVDQASYNTNTQINNWMKQQPGYVKHTWKSVDSNNGTVRQVWESQQQLEAMLAARESNPDYIAKLAHETAVGITRTVVSQGVDTE